jgi:hypothetical protein
LYYNITASYRSGRLFLHLKGRQDSKARPLTALPTTNLVESGSMASHNGASRITPQEIFGLADRLSGHAKHVIFDPVPELRRNIILAARLLKHLLGHGIIIVPINLD